MKEIYHCFWIDAPISKVYDAITTETDIAGWWTKNLEVDGSVGSVSTFRFKSGAFNKMKIVQSDIDRVDWECVDGFEDWIGTKIRFELRDDGGSTKVCFSHYSWREQSEYTGECSYHWAGYLKSLQNYCETGKGDPNDGS